MVKLNDYISKTACKLKGNSLKAKTARGSLIIAFGTFVERIMRLVRNMILARLLSPEDFGLMAMVMAVLVAMESFADVGVQQAIIQNRNGSKEEFLNVAWWFQAIRSLALFIIVYLITPKICQFYGKPELLNLLRISVLSSLTFGLISPRVAVFEKEIRFTRIMVLTQGSSLCGIFLTIVLALYMQNVWVLVIGRVGEGVIRLVFSFVICPFRIKFGIDRASLKEIFKFSKGMFGLSFLTIVTLQIDVFVLGKMVSPERLGMYALAIALAQQPVGMFGQIIGRAFFPAFSEKQDDKEALCRTILKMARLSILIGVPMLVLATIFAKPILSVIYGLKYATVAIPFRILCVTMLFRIQGIVLAGVFLAIGKPHIHRRFTFFSAVLIVCLIYPGIAMFGLEGAAGVLLLSSMIVVILQIISMRHYIGLEFRDYLCCWLPASILNYNKSKLACWKV